MKAAMNHTTNYFNTFIEIATDCPAKSAEIPPQKGEEKTVAVLQFELISHNPYKYTSDEIIFNVFALRKKIPAHLLSDKRNLFFSKGQACLRSSPLGKRYGWGILYNEEGRIAVYAAESEKYKTFANDVSLIRIKAMRSGKKL